MTKLTIKTPEQMAEEQVYEARDWSTPKSVAEWYLVALKMDIKDMKATGRDPGRTHGGMGHEARAEFVKLPEAAEVMGEFREVFGYGLFSE